MSVDRWLALLTSVLVAAGLTGSALAAETRIALVIGNSNYAHAPALRNPANDASLIAEALTDAGFDVVRQTDLSQRGMRLAVRDFAQRLQEAEGEVVSLLYYAGHGMQVDGVNYLIPVDAAIERASDVAIDSLSMGDVMTAIEHARPRMTIVVLDACRDNPFQRGFRSATRGLAQVDAPTGSIIGYATAPGATAADGEGTNSPYSQALADTIRRPDVPIERVFKLVRIRVHEATNGRQTPWESSSLTGDFFFNQGAGETGDDGATPPTTVGGGTSPVDPPVRDDDQAGDATLAYLAAVEANTVEAFRSFIQDHPTAPQAEQARALLKGRIEDRVWRAAAEKNTARAYRDYLTAFPDGVNADQARRRLAELEAKVAVVPQRPEVEPNECGHPHGSYRTVDIASWDVLYVRERPDKNARDRGGIPPNGTGVGVGRCVSVKGYRHRWCEVRYKCLTGWAYARYLRDTRTAAASTERTYKVVNTPAWDMLNVRSGPGTKYAIVGKIPHNGRGIRVGQCRRVAGYSKNWCRVRYGAISGWASACCLADSATGRRP